MVHTMRNITDVTTIGLPPQYFWAVLAKFGTQQRHTNNKKENLIY
jgi:hypothetical protein